MIKLGSAGAEIEFDSIEEAQVYLESITHKKIELELVDSDGPRKQVIKLAFDPSREKLIDVLVRVKSEIDRDRALSSKGMFVETKAHLEA